MKMIMQLYDLKEVVKRSQSVLRKEAGQRFLRFDVHEKELKITGIGNEANIIMTIPVIADKKDSFLLPFDKLYQVLMKTEGKDLQITHKEKAIDFQCENMKMNLAPMKISLCSLLQPIRNPEISIHVNSEELCQGIRFCNHVLPGQNQIVPSIIRTFLIELLTDTIRVTATDTRRIAQCGPDDTVTASVTIQGSIVNAVSEFLNGNVSIKKEGEIFEISDNQTIIRGRSPSGKYPMLHAFFKQDYVSRIICNRKDLMHAIELVTCFQKIIRISVEKDRMLLTSIPGEMGSISMNVSCISDTVFQCCLNGKYLLEALSARIGEEVTISCMDSLHPIYLNGNNQNEIIMPINQENNS